MHAKKEYRVHCLHCKSQAKCKNEKELIFLCGNGHHSMLWDIVNHINTHITDNEWKQTRLQALLFDGVEYFPSCLEANVKKKIEDFM